jgi:hypothetical protein
VFALQVLDPFGRGHQATSVTERAPACLTAATAAALDLPVASIGSSTIASLAVASSGSFT